MNIPVVFYRIGDPWPATLAIQKAVKTNEVCLIADRNCAEGIKGCFYFDASPYLDAARKWRERTNPSIKGLCDIASYERFFVILQACRKNGWEIVWHCDTDTMIFANANDEFARIGKQRFTLQKCPEVTKRGGVLCSASQSLIPVDVLEKFIANPGHGDNDMAAWTHFVLREGIAFWDSSEPRDGWVWDHHIGNNIEEYENDGKFKKIEFVDGMPAVVHKTLGKLKTPFIHCWGPAKPLMEQFL